MTLQELSVEYRAHARALDLRICQLQAVLDRTEDEDERCLLAERIRMLSTICLLYTSPSPRDCS